ncbi:HNH endonuclease [bacterium]|nr:HNH endonuclease [bacterium]
MLGWLRRTTEELFGAGRSGKWPRVRREHLEREPTCVACGRSRDLEVHHIVPFHDRPELELDPENLITLCADPCHLVFGHVLNFRRSNPYVREDAERYRERIRNFGSASADC